jgi:hypothetical protein
MPIQEKKCGFCGRLYPAVLVDPVNGDRTHPIRYDKALKKLACNACWEKNAPPAPLKS